MPSGCCTRDPHRRGCRIYSVDRSCQMILFYKCWKICRAHELALRSHCVCHIKFVHTKLVWHDNIHIIRNFSRDPMMSSDGLKPPDLVYILKCNSVHLIGSISFKQAAKSLHALSCALYIWKCNADYILLRYLQSSQAYLPPQAHSTPVDPRRALLDLRLWSPSPS